MQGLGVRFIGGLSRLPGSRIGRIPGSLGRHSLAIGDISGLASVRGFQFGDRGRRCVGDRTPVQFSDVRVDLIECGSQLIAGLVVGRRANVDLLYSRHGLNT
ncbi:hypothetical protein NH44784_027551 [Achromobacter xylosoxidans NH44784-1996]|nr:hypothetical protein NH44784_027551 [Achromobacter xylosoxidans NH44784-1996]